MRLGAGGFPPVWAVHAGARPRGAASWIWNRCPEASSPRRRHHQEDRETFGHGGSVITAGAPHRPYCDFCHLLMNLAKFDLQIKSEKTSFHSRSLRDAPPFTP